MAKKVLIVDDEIGVVNAIESLLRAKGYEVITADHGLRALDKARTQSPDLIILDVMLPKLDGYKICRMLKFDDNYRQIPIIMFTGHGSEEEQRLGFETGADAYIAKPVGIDVLLSKIEELLYSK